MCKGKHKKLKRQTFAKKQCKNLQVAGIIRIFAVKV
jgi:hypothetical protein